MRTKNDRIGKATDVVVVSFHVIPPKGPGYLGEALKNYKSVEKAFKTETCVQLYLIFHLKSGITDYQIKAARQHKMQYGRGVPLPSVRSRRMKVSLSQLDNFLSFITSPHIVQDLPFAQRHLKL